MKEMIEFELEDGTRIWIEGEEESRGMQRVGRGDGNKDEKKAGKFTKALAGIKPAAETVLNSFREMNTPDEIGLEFGMKFSAKAGAVFASADSEATFKVSLKWTNPKSESGKGDSEKGKETDGKEPDRAEILIAKEDAGKES